MARYSKRIGSKELRYSQCLWEHRIYTIGRELYTAPFIWIGADKFNITQRNGKYATYDKFIVSDIEIVDKKITRLEIVNAKTNAICFRWSNGAAKSTPKNAKANAGSENEKTKAAEQQAATLTDESKDKLNAAIAAYVKLTGIDINQVMSMLKNAIKKSPKAYTEMDAGKALSVIAKWQQEFMDTMGV